MFQSFRDTVGEAVGARAFATADAEQAALLDQLCRPDSSHLVFVGTAAGEIVGFVTMSLNRATRIGEIGLNAVDPSHARQGIGTRLDAFALSLMRDEGMQWRQSARAATQAMRPHGAPMRNLASGPEYPP